MVETDVHYPTDINLLFDAIRKVITLIAPLSTETGIKGWRQSAHNLRQIKKRYRRVQRIKRSRSKVPENKAQRDQLIREAYLAYLDVVSSFLERARETIAPLSSETLLVKALASRLALIECYIGDAAHQIDLIKRRVLGGEVIPHEEKIFSIFERHTEWISKGKAGVPVELGLRVCIVEDQYGFVVHHLVMERQSDVEVAVEIIEQTKARFASLTRCSFDQGFHSPENQRRLLEFLDEVILPKKGRRTASERAREQSEGFVAARRAHSAVESAIHALENHGLDRCRDHGVLGFKRYVGLAVLARNLQIVGNLLQQRALQRLQRCRVAA